MDYNIHRLGSNSIKKPEPKQSNQIQVNTSELKEISQSILSKQNMNEDIIALVPELKQAKELLKNSIISPNDYSKKDLITSFENYLGFPDKVIGEAISILDTAVIKFKLINDLDNIVNAIFDTGADVEVILPRNLLLKKLLSNGNVRLKTTKDLESFDFNTNINSNGVYKLDNLVKIEDITLDTENQNLIIDENKILGLSDIGISKFESFSMLPLQEIYISHRDDVLRKNAYDMESIDVSKDEPNQSTEEKNKHFNPTDSIGLLDIYKNFRTKSKEAYISVTPDTNLDYDDRPFRINVAASAVIPIYTDDKTKQIGSFILTDEMIKPIVGGPSDDDIENSLNIQNPSMENGVFKGIIKRANAALGKNKDTSVTLTNMMDTASSMLSVLLENGMKKSVYKNNYNIEYEDNVIKLLLYRIMKAKQTKIMFVPAEYLSYIAFDYRNNGTGKTLFEDISVLASFKSMLLLSKVYAEANNNIPIREYIVDIDENDPAPKKTEERITQMIYDQETKGSPWGSTSLERMGTWAQNKGYRMIFNHRTFPNTTISQETKNKEFNYTPADSGVMETISNAILRNLGLSPSILEEANNVEFASVALINNALSHKIIATKQEILDKGLSDRIVKLCKTDYMTRQNMTKLVMRNKSKIIKCINDELELEEGKKLKELTPEIISELVLDMIESFRVSVPRAESRDREEIREKFESFAEHTDTLLEAFTESSFLEEYADEKEITIDVIKNSLKLMALVDWCEEHNYAKGLIKLINTTDKNVLKETLERIRDKDSSLLALADTLKKKADKKLNEEEEDEDDIDDNSDGVDGVSLDDNDGDNNITDNNGDDNTGDLGTQEEDIEPDETLTEGEGETLVDE